MSLRIQAAIGVASLLLTINSPSAQKVGKRARPTSTRLAQAEPAKSGKNLYVPYFSLVVVYRQRLDEEARIEVTELHRKVGGRLLYRSKRLPIDFVLPSDPKKSRDELEILCKQYRQNDLVNECVVDEPGIIKYSQVAHTGGSAAPAKGSDAPDNRLLEPVGDHSGRALNDDQLSRYWGQEYIGADLAKERVRASSTPVTRPEVAVIDAGFRADAIDAFKGGTIVESTPLQNAAAGGKDAREIAQAHGTSAANVVAGSETHSVSEAAQIGLLGAGASLIDGAKSFEASFDKRLLSYSMVAGNEAAAWNVKSIEAYLQSSPNAILVQAAGNGYPRAVSPIDAKAAKAGAFLVGNLDENGFMDASSQESEDVLVAAPAANSLTTRARKGDGGLQPFGGTSAATPMVTGAIANALAVAPQLSRAQVRALIVGSAVPTLASRQRPRKNGAGMINAYLLVRLAEKLRSKCAAASNVPACYTRQIKSGGFFKIDDPETRTAIRDGLNNFPECRASLTGKLPDGDPGYSPTRESKQRAIKLARQLFFINQAESASAAELLACAYRSAGFPHNANFYAGLTLHRDMNGLEGVNFRRRATASVGDKAPPLFFDTIDFNRHGGAVVRMLGWEQQSPKSLAESDFTQLRARMLRLEKGNLDARGRGHVENVLKIGRALRGREAFFSEIEASLKKKHAI